jgi:hypothetical protein
MDATSGLLMAVKQVEVPTVASDERKKTMTDALEREIELLKDLQHENIVQYLCVSFQRLVVSSLTYERRLQTHLPTKSTSTSSWNMFQVVPLPHCCETTVHSKKLLSATLFAKFWRDCTTFMSEALSIVISRVRTSWWTTRVVSKSPTLAFLKSWKTVSHVVISHRCLGLKTL